MNTRLLTLAVIIGATLLSFGCAEQPKPVAMEPPFYVPATTVVQSADKPVRSLAYQLLASSEADDYFVGREEKAVYGSVVLGEVTSYSTYTYDQQRISSSLFGDTGYKYRYVVQQGVSFP